MTVLPSRENVEWDDRDATRQTQSLTLPAPVACLVSDGARAGPFSAFWQVSARPEVGAVCGKAALTELAGGAR